MREKEAGQATTASQEEERTRRQAVGACVVEHMWLKQRWWIFGYFERWKFAFPLFILFTIVLDTEPYAWSRAQL